MGVAGGKRADLEERTLLLNLAKIRIREDMKTRRQLALAMTPAQCRAARALLDMSTTSLAGAAVVPASAVMEFESGVAAPNEARIIAMQQALVRTGVEFIERGVRLIAGASPDRDAPQVRRSPKRD